MNFNPTRDFASRLNPKIRSPRLSLEPLLGSHADILFMPMQDVRIYKWIEAGGPKNIDQLRSKWKSIESRISPDGKEILLNWAIRIDDDGDYIGKLDAQLDNYVNVFNIGFAFFPKCWGKGYATESVLAVRDWLAENGVIAMRATVATSNIASSRVLEKAGFIRGNLSKTELDTYEYDLIIKRPQDKSAQQGDAPEPAT